MSSGPVPYLFPPAQAGSQVRASGDEETRTPDPRLAKAVLSQLSYIPSKVGKVGLVGLEPTTSPLSEERSNRLSYKPVNISIVIRKHCATFFLFLPDALASGFTLKRR